MFRLADRVFAIIPETVPVYPYEVRLYIEDERSVVIDLGSGGNAFNAIPQEKVDWFGALGSEDKSKSAGCFPP